MYPKVLTFLLILAKFQFSLQEDPLVQLPNGSILGREDTTSEDKSYYAFEKIPYAAPPVGDLRFQPPQPVDDWNGTLNTTHLDVSCYQMGMPVPVAMPSGTESEDCLFLNVFTPKITNDGLLPVMVFIHGGGFTGGSAMNNPPDLFINHDVILVSINYRLGVFGFISTADAVIPGNNGLKDQAFALQWVQDNIKFFGGDPEKVTIFGQSAGAGSCAHHVLNQNSAGLFRGVILESGTFLCTGMFQRNPRKMAFGTGSVLDSSFETKEDSEALLELLKSVDADVLNEAASNYTNGITNAWDHFLEVGSVFAPVIEVDSPDAFLTEKMYQLLKSGNVLPVATLMGFTSEEKLTGDEEVKSIATILDENPGLAVPVDVPTTDDDARADLGISIRDIYTEGEPWAEHLSETVRFSSDNFLGRSMIRHAELFAKIADTYFYQFSFSGQLDSPGGGPRTFSIDSGSVGHGGELTYLFCSGTSCTDSSIAEADLLTRQRLSTLWTNFAKYGNPTPEASDLLQNITWSRVNDGDEGDFLFLDVLEDLFVKNHPKEETYSKWVELYEGLDYDDFETY